MKTDLFLVAGEPSGDLHGAHLIKALSPPLKIAAVAGERMRTLISDVPLQMEELQVMGFMDVLKALPRLFRVFRHIRAEILQRAPRAVVFIDYPDFNLRLARSLRVAGYRGKLIHFICPTVWAWRRGRVSFMAKHLDLLLTLFPFEKELFASTKLTTIYVGHPLVKTIQKEASQQRDDNLLALFPGSRKAVIERNLPLQLAAAKRLQAIYPQLKIEISSNPKNAYDLMQRAHLAIASSGTVTLELALFNTPTVVQYAIGALDLFLARNVFRIDLPHYCIVNILTNQRVFPELFGPNLTIDALVKEARELWASLEARNRCSAGCDKMRTILGTSDASQTAASAIMEALSE